jgi:hypothetical protein
MSGLYQATKFYRVDSATGATLARGDRFMHGTVDAVTLQGDAYVVSVIQTYSDQSDREIQERVAIWRKSLRWKIGTRLELGGLWIRGKP